MRGASSPSPGWATTIPSRSAPAKRAAVWRCPSGSMKAELKGVPEYTRVMPSSVVERDGEVFYRDPVKGAAGAFSDLLMSGRDEASELVRDQIF